MATALFFSTTMMPNTLQCTKTYLHRKTYNETLSATIQTNIAFQAR